MVTLPIEAESFDQQEKLELIEYMTQFEIFLFLLKIPFYIAKLI